MKKEKKSKREYLTCNTCSKSDETVSSRICGYIEDVHNEEVYEDVCDACEQEHLMDI
jgi:anaerobic ribonucleoside-triphosphate reductase